MGMRDPCLASRSRRCPPVACLLLSLVLLDAGAGGCLHSTSPEPLGPEQVLLSVETALRAAEEAQSAARLICEQVAVNAETVRRAAAEAIQPATNRWRTAGEAQDALRLCAETPALAAHAVGLAMEARRYLDNPSRTDGADGGDRMRSAAVRMARLSLEESAAVRRACDSLRGRWLLLASDPELGAAMTNRPPPEPERIQQP